MFLLKETQIIVFSICKEWQANFILLNNVNNLISFSDANLVHINSNKSEYFVFHSINQSQTMGRFPKR